MRDPRARAAISAVVALSLILAGSAFAKKVPPPLHSVDLNAATVKELVELPGIGPTTAKEILQFRAKSGRFHRVEDLLAIKGISVAKLNQIRPYVTLGSAPPAPVKPATPKKPSTSPNSGGTAPAPAPAK